MSMNIVNVKGLEDYLINKKGEIYSEKSKRLLKVRVSLSGYLQVQLMIDRVCKPFYIHRLLMVTYKPTKDTNLVEVNHIDGDKLNNDLDNLEWVTRKQNLKHALETGLRDMKDVQKHGVESKNRILNGSDVDDIYVGLKEGKLQKDLAVKYGVSQMTISNIKNKKRWKKHTDNLDIEYKWNVQRPEKG